MTKESILQILNINKELIKNIFSIDDSGIDKIRTFLEKERKDFKDVVDSIFNSDMNNREKMFIYYLIGYDNGKRKSLQNMIFEKDFKIK